MICTASRRGVTLVPSLSLFRPLSLSVSFSHGWSIDTEDFVSRRLADSLLISSGFVVFERVTRLDRAAWFPGHLPSPLDFLASSRIPTSNLIRLKCHPTKVLFRARLSSVQTVKNWLTNGYRDPLIRRTRDYRLNRLISYD